MHSIMMDQLASCVTPKLAVWTIVWQVGITWCVVGFFVGLTFILFGPPYCEWEGWANEHPYRNMALLAITTGIPAGIFMCIITIVWGTL